MRYRRFLAASLLVAIALGGSALAGAGARRVPRRSAPFELSLPLLRGRELSAERISEPTVVFYRSARCGHCRIELDRWMQSLAHRRMRGNRLPRLLVIGSDERYLDAASVPPDLPVSFATDSNRRVMTALGVRAVPHVALVVPPNRVIRFDVGETQTYSIDARIDELFRASASR